MTERARWRMTLQELCHRVDARPQDLVDWARLGALGPAWQETTENKWRHITKKVANRAIVMRYLLDAGLAEELAARIADSAADRLAAGDKLGYGDGLVQVQLDPTKMDLE